MEVKLNESPVVIPPPTVTITLSYKEACALMAICGKVHGTSKEIKENLTSPLYDQLSKALGQASTFWPNPFTEIMEAAEGFWEELPDRP